MMNDIMKKVYEYKVVPEINNLPVEEKPRDQSFSLVEKRKS